MKIYLYLKHFPPEGKGKQLNEGTAKALHGLACGLTHCKAEVTVLCESSQEVSYHTEYGYKIKSFINQNPHSTDFKISAGLQKYICNNLNEQCLVILNGIFHLSVYGMSRLLYKLGIPYIVAPHDPYSPAFFRKNAHLKYPYWYLFEKKMLKQAKAVQLLDARHANFLHSLGVNNKILTAPNGFSPKDVKAESSLIYQQDETVKLFFLGRLDIYNKGIDLLLNAFLKIIKIHNVCLTIQGPDWGDKADLQAQIKKLSLDEKVYLLDPDYNQSPSSIMQNHHVVCIPSRFEGFSLSALEAMLAGRVLLVSEIAGIAPYVKASDCGVVVSPFVSAIESGLTQLLQRRSEWKEMGLAGRRYALENLQWNKIASSTLEQYKQLIA